MWGWRGGEVPEKVEDTREPGTAAGLRRAALRAAGTKVVVPPISGP